MQFGNYDCFCIELDRFRIDGGAMFGVIPKALWEKKVPPDRQNRIPMIARSLVMAKKGRTILVDAGIGNKIGAKMMRNYGIEAGAGSLAARLAPHGLTVSDITDVLITHLHFDHAGGCTELKDGAVIPAFPNAVYHVQKAHLEYSRSPSPRDHGSFFAENVEPLAECGVLNIMDGPSDHLFEGISLRISDGHTQGQMFPVITGDGETLCFCADLIPTSAHLPLVWNMSYDNYPMKVIEEKSALLEQAAREGWVLCFPHDANIPAARIKMHKGNAVVGSAVSYKNPIWLSG